MRFLVCVPLMCLWGCELALPEIDNPFVNPERSLRATPDTVPYGDSTLSVSDDERRLDFRDVWEVQDLGDYRVLNWHSNDEEVRIDLEVFDDAVGTQELMLEFDDGDTYVVPFEVR